MQAIEPGAALKALPDGSLELSTPDATAGFEIWENAGGSRDSADTMVVAGGVLIRNRRFSTPLVAANVVYEQVGDRLEWQVYRFSIGFCPPERYRFGPYGRSHGFRRQDFFDERATMVHPAMHVWQKTVTALNSDEVLNLFKDAIELRPPDQRTGLWQ